MDIQAIKETLRSYHVEELPTGGSALAGIVSLIMIFKTGKNLFKVLLVIVAIGLFAAAYWWHTHK
jgi:hypothetical protein